MKTLRKILVISLTAVASLVLTAAVVSAQPRADDPPPTGTHPRGAGSTFAAPIIDAWLTAYRAAHPGFEPSYEAIGSGDGVARFLAGEIDFAATDAPLDVDTMPGDVVRLPLTAGMISIVYNLPGVETPLTLPRDVYSDIFLGRLYRWDDPRIAASNRGVSLPPTPIQVVARQDSSGTTFAFTNHLAAISAAWADGPGVGKSIDWPSGAMLARGNEGVAQRVRLSEGAIAYVESGLAGRLGMTNARLENAAGTLVAPTLSAGQAALAAPGAADSNALSRMIVDPDDKAAYPIVTYSWWLQHRDGDAPLTGLLRWALGTGEDAAEPLGYLPLSNAVVKAALAELDGASS